MLTQLQNLKKHLHNEQIQVENELNNAVSAGHLVIWSNKFQAEFFGDFFLKNNRTTVGQLSDMHHRILNVRTPPGSPFSSAMNKEPVRLRRDYTTDFQKTYRKDYRSEFTEIRPRSQAGTGFSQPDSSKNSATTGRQLFPGKLRYA